VLYVAHYLQEPDTAGGVNHGLHEHVGRNVINADFIDALKAW
jgi:hypothetical protein